MAQSSSSLGLEPLVRVKILVAELRTKMMSRIGLQWPASIEGQILPSLRVPADSTLNIGINALEESGLGRVLASPVLLCRSGKEAEFLAGGEFPIKIANFKHQDVIWKRYGVLLKIKPKADFSGRMSIGVTTEVSTIDSAQTVDGIPGLLTNRIETHFDLESSKTIALSGLIKREWGDSTSGLPSLGSLPILGPLFSSQDFRDNKTELVVFVTPEVMRPGFGGQMTLAELTQLNQTIKTRIEKLPPMDPLTLVDDISGPYVENREIRTIVGETCASLSHDIKTRMEEEYFGAGPLTPLFEDPFVTEIIVNGRDSIWFEKHGRLERLNDRFLSPLTYRNFISRLGREAGFQTNLDCPFADGQWRGCRVHLISPPASGDEAVLTLRRHPSNPWNLDTLLETGWASKSAIEKLQNLIRERKNFLVIGPTGSGKTSVLNACLQTLPSHERTVLIEDTSELCAPNAASTKLLTRRDVTGQLREIDQGELVRQALRMRPDRIVMGEIRGPEAKDLLMAFATGHSGCMGTLHADSARQALLRLEMLIQLGASQWSLHAVRTLILLSLQAIVVVERTNDGKRRLEGLYKISSLEEVGFLLERDLV